MSTRPTSIFGTWPNQGSGPSSDQSTEERSGALRIADFELDGPTLERKMRVTPNGAPYRLPDDPFDRILDLALLLADEPRRGSEGFLHGQQQRFFAKFSDDLSDRALTLGIGLVGQLRSLHADSERELVRTDRRIMTCAEALAETERSLQISQVRLRRLAHSEPESQPRRAHASSWTSGFVNLFKGRGLKEFSDLVDSTVASVRAEDEWSKVVEQSIQLWRERENRAWSLDRARATRAVQQRAHDLVALALSRIDELVESAQSSLNRLMERRESEVAQCSDWTKCFLPDLSPDISLLSQSLANDLGVRVPVEWVLNPETDEGAFHDVTKSQARAITRAALAGSTLESLFVRESERRGRPANAEQVRRTIFNALLNDLETGARPHNFATVGDRSIGRRTIVQLTGSGQVFEETGRDAGVTVRAARLPWSNVQAVAFLEFVDNIDANQLVAVKAACDAVDAENHAGRFNALLPELLPPAVRIQPVTRMPSGLAPSSLVVETELPTVATAAD